MLDEIKLNGNIYAVSEILENDNHPKRGEFLKNVYNYYVNIRICIGGQRCNKMTLNRLKFLLSEQTNRTVVHNAMKLNDKEINTILLVAEQYIKMVK